MWLFDTVALSELAKSPVNPGFMAWLSGARERDIHTSVLCLGEIRRGLVMLTHGAKRAALTRWLETDLTDRLGGRVLPVDAAVAQAWGWLGLRGANSSVDALIGVTAASHGLTVVTRNVRDFDGLGVPVLNPWTSP